MGKLWIIAISLAVLAGCGDSNNRYESRADGATDTATYNRGHDTAIRHADVVYIHTGNTGAAELVNYAKTLIGTQYKYASSNPAEGFDCSGFITYVFRHFGIEVPRSSAGFTNVYHPVPLHDAKPGDLILFTGTDSSIRSVGHMGIVVYHQPPELLFIHSTSGKAYGVTITRLNNYYLGRFVKVVRVFGENDHSR